ncbi:BTAD domain-containing putative transcriptional regulator [Actinomadura rudentiformis]|uniref:BTAD domain-containing putative transcriptional regulator n=1 Tax=Actinomadura rudentiformis TaxID=359158 RepID=UPI00178C5D8B|nr:BTAD domain-containing putative transcriptional regulator [Actinomadura rudentiformis]
MTEGSGAAGSLRFEILGRLRAWRDDEELELGPGKQRAVLAVLLVNAGRPVPVPAIVDAVWGDDPPDNGANVVQKYVAGLRRVLEPGRSPRSPGELLTLSPAGYALKVDPGGLDAEVFQRQVRHALAVRAGGDAAEAAALLRAALAIWREDALAGIKGPVFDAARDRLSDERASALEACAEIELELGRHAELVPELTRLVADFPLREQLRYLLILALYRCGRQAEALAAYRDARAFLIEEFGVEPGERLQQLQLGILRSDPALGGPAASTSGPASGPAPAIAPPTPAHAPVSPVAPVSWAPPAGGDATAPSGSPRTVRTSPSWPLKLLVASIPVITCGTVGWAVIAFFAARRRSVPLGLAAAGYLAAEAIFMAVALHTDADVATPWDVPMMIAWFVAMFGAAAHIVLLMSSGPSDPERARDLGRVDPVLVELLERRTRREQARALVRDHPEIARRLRVGRPDVSRTFDDGGLVDVNDAPRDVLAGLPGVGPHHAMLIVAVREGKGPFASTEDLIVQGLLPAHVVRALHEVLIAIPAEPEPDPSATGQ